MYLCISSVSFCVIFFCYCYYLYFSNIINIFLRNYRCEFKQKSASSCGFDRLHAFSKDQLMCWLSCRSIVEEAMQCKKKILQNDGVVTSPCARPRKAGHTLLILGGQTFMCDKIYQVKGPFCLCGVISCNALSVSLLSGWCELNCYVINMTFNGSFILSLHL